MRLFLCYAVIHEASGQVILAMQVERLGVARLVRGAGRNPVRR